MLTLTHLTGFCAAGPSGGSGAPPPGVWTASSSGSAYPGTAASYALLSDGDAATGFGSASGGGDVITVDFGAVVTLSSMQAQAGSITGWGAVYSYALTVSVDYWTGTGWASLTSYAQGGAAGWRVPSFAPVETSKIRLTGTGNWFGLSGLSFA